MSNPTQPEDDVEIKELATLDNSVALTAVDRAQIDGQVATAKAYPRSVDKSLKAARSLALLDQETAASMFYTLKRKEADGSDKFITGSSIRLAEVMINAWGNLRVDAMIESEDKSHLTAVGTCFDTERNVAVRVRVRRRCTTKKGHRYGEDMMAVTANAAISIALRNAVFRVIPRVFVDKLLGECQQSALGKGTIAQKRQNALTWFAKLGVKAEQVFGIIGVKGIDDLDEEKLIVLRGLKNGIEQGETTIDKLLNPDKTDDAEATASLNQSLKSSASVPSNEAQKPEPAADTTAAEPAKPKVDNTNRTDKVCAECGAKPGEKHGSGCPYFEDEDDAQGSLV